MPNYWVFCNIASMLWNKSFGNIEGSKPKLAEQSEKTQTLPCCNLHVLNQFFKPKKEKLPTNTELFPKMVLDDLMFIDCSWSIYCCTFSLIRFCKKLPSISMEKVNGTLWEYSFRECFSLLYLLLDDILSICHRVGSITTHWAKDRPEKWKH